MGQHQKFNESTGRMKFSKVNEWGLILFDAAPYDK